MTMLRTVYRIKLEILSPLFIGSGNAYFSDEYLILADEAENIDMLYRFYFADIFENLSDNERCDIQKNNMNPLYLRNKMHELLKKYFMNGAMKPIYSLPVNEGIAKKFNVNITEKSQHNDSNQLKIQEFVQNSFGQKYIPGSSIKGAIATAMQEVFPKIKTGSDGDYNSLMVTDSEVFSCMDSFEIKKLKRKGQKSALPADYEILISGNTECCIKLRNNDIFTKEKIIEACEKYAKKQISYSLEFIKKRASNFDKFKAKNGQEQQKKEAYNDLDAFFTKYIPTKYAVSQNLRKSFLLNLGFGGGAVFKMFSPEKGGRYSWSVKTQGKPILVEDMPSTFWMTEQKVPLGWVKCTFLD